MRRTHPIPDAPDVPPICMSRRVMCRIMSTIGANQPETGGILLGPIGAGDITDFYFDVTAACTGGTYTPDHVTLTRKMQEEWLPAGMDFKGFVHSHPGRFDRLSAGDMEYIGRLLAKNPDITAFAAPIVIPREFRLRPIIVLRNSPHIQRRLSCGFFANPQNSNSHKGDPP